MKTVIFEKSIIKCGLSAVSNIMDSYAAGLTPDSKDIKDAEEEGVDVALLERYLKHVNEVTHES